MEITSAPINVLEKTPQVPIDTTSMDASPFSLNLGEAGPITSTLPSPYAEFEWSPVTERGKTRPRADAFDGLLGREKIWYVDATSFRPVDLVEWRSQKVHSVFVDNGIRSVILDTGVAMLSNSDKVGHAALSNKNNEVGLTGTALAKSRQERLTQEYRKQGERVVPLDIAPEDAPTLGELQAALSAWPEGTELGMTGAQLRAYVRERVDPFLWDLMTYRPDIDHGIFQAYQFEDALKSGQDAVTKIPENGSIEDAYANLLSRLHP